MKSIWSKCAHCLHIPEENFVLKYEKSWMNAFSYFWRQSHRNIMSCYNLQHFGNLSICEKQPNSSQQHGASFKLTYDLLTWKYKFESIIFDLNTLGCVNDVGLQSSGPLFKDFYKPEEVGLFISLPCAKGSKQWDNLNSVIEKIYLIFVYGISQWAFDKRNAIF